MTHNQKISFDDLNGEKYEGVIYFSLFASKKYVILNHCFDSIQHSETLKEIIHSLISLSINVLCFEKKEKNQTNNVFKNIPCNNTMMGFLAANQFLSTYYYPPSLIIGHSINGLTALLASAHLDNIKGVIVLSGCTPDFIINKKNVFGKDLLDSLHSVDVDSILNQFSKPLLIFHSQSDSVIPFSDSFNFYERYKGIKNFIALDDADHYYSHPLDIQYVLNIIEIWIKKWILLGQIEPSIALEQVMVQSHEGLEQKIFNQAHQWNADEPVLNGGKNKGPDPYALLLSALGACTNMTLKIYADYKKIDLGGVKTILSYEKKPVHPDEPDKISLVVSREIIFQNQLLTTEIQKRLESIANKCPVHKTLTGDIVIETKTYQAGEK